MAGAPITTQHRFQPGAMAQLAAADVPHLKLKWAFGFPGASRAVAQPTIIGGRVFVGSQGGKVYSLDAKSGCTYWEFDAGVPVRSAIVVGQGPDGWTAYFGDLGAFYGLGANVHAVDVLTGKALWKTLIDDHPAALVTGSPILVGTTLYVPVSSFEEVTGANSHYACCNFRGSVVALQASTGKQLWKGYTIAQEPAPGAVNIAGVQLMGPSGAAVWSSPTFDDQNRMVYVTTGDNYSDPPTETSDAILAFNADTGQLAWSRQTTPKDAYNIACSRPGAASNCPNARGPDYDFGSSAILVHLADGKRALIGAQKSGVVTAVDPDRHGEIIWQKRVGHGSALGGVQWGSATDGDTLYVAVSDIKLGVVPLGTAGSQPSVFNPNVAFLLDSTEGGGLHALRLQTGEESLAHASPRLQRGCRMQPRTIGRRHCDPERRVLRRPRRSPPGLLYRGWQYRLGCRHKGRLSYRQWRHCPRWFDRRTGPSCRRRDALCEFGIRHLWVDTGKRPASILGGGSLIPDDFESTRSPGWVASEVIVVKLEFLPRGLRYQRGWDFPSKVSANEFSSAFIPVTVLAKTSTHALTLSGEKRTSRCSSAI